MIKPIVIQSQRFSPVESTENPPPKKTRFAQYVSTLFHNSPLVPVNTNHLNLKRLSSLPPPPQRTTLAKLFANDPIAFNSTSLESMDNEHVKGAYFKKTSQTSRNNRTLVCGASGNTYALLNKLTPQDVEAIQQQHNIVEEITPEDATQGKTIAHGGFGKIRYARNIETGEIGVVKKVSSSIKTIGESIARTDGYKNARSDIALPLQIKHRIQELRRQGKPLSNIEQSFALFDDFAVLDNKPMRNELEGENRANLPDDFGTKAYLFSKLANLGDGEMAVQRMQTSNKTPEEQLLIYVSTAKRYAKVLHDLHALGFHHRDIKTTNFLHSLTPDGQEMIQLSDFGLTTDAIHQKTQTNGTKGFIPPEFHNYAGYDAAKHDAYSLGCTFERMKPEALHSPPNTANQHPASIRKTSQLMDTLIKDLTKRNPRDRLSVAKAFARLIKIENSLLKTQQPAPR